MSLILLEAVRNHLQGIIDELKGLGFDMEVRDGVVTGEGPDIEGMKLLPAPAAAAPAQAADAGAGGGSKAQTPSKTPPPKKKRAAPGSTKPLCRFDGPEKCDRESITKGFCGKHAQQFYKGKIDENGKPVSPKS